VVAKKPSGNHTAAMNLGRTCAPILLTCVGIALVSCRVGPVAPTLPVQARDFAFTMPRTIPSGLVRISLSNSGQDLHEAMVVHFIRPGGSALAYVDSVRAHVSFPVFAEDIGGAALTMPGGSSAVWLVLQPGQYAVVCWKGNHLELGMAHDLTVTTTPSGAERPTASAELVLRDFSYLLDRPLTAGHQVLHVVNRGTESHEADILRITDSTGYAAYVRWLENDVGLPPIIPVGGIGDLMPGREAWMELQLTPGRYLIICTMKAANGGKPHHALGMRYEFTVR
jgi:uncharacterized cupredoxin-like copper-binding protein